MVSLRSGRGLAASSRCPRLRADAIAPPRSSGDNRPPWRRSTSPAIATPTRTRSRRPSATPSSRAAWTPATLTSPVRLGECNAQTRWLLERSGARQPQFLPHVMVRACDVMQSEFPIARAAGADPARPGLEMARAGLEIVPVVDDDGALAGVDDRARAGPPLHPRDARDLDPAGRPDPGLGDRRGARRPAPHRRGQDARPAACGCTRWTPPAAAPRRATWSWWATGRTPSDWPSSGGPSCSSCPTTPSPARRSSRWPGSGAPR